MILVGDIGGTKTRLALFVHGLPPEVPLREEVFASSQYTSLENLVREFLGPDFGDVKAAAFGVAGPVVNGMTKLTNLPWVLDQAGLVEALAIPRVVLVNDVMATATSIPHLREGEFLTLQQGKADPQGNIAVIAPGTGLGEAFMISRDGQWQSFATEGGHADFAPRNNDELVFWQDLREETDRVSCETVCAGPGIARIYRHLRDRFPQEESGRVKNALAGAADPTPVIVGNAMSQETACPLCVRTLRFYVSVLGAEAGNLALKVMGTGGVYLAGGIPPRILPFLKEEGFLGSFNDKGCMSHLMAGIPVHVILEPRAALLGAAYWLWDIENRKGDFDCREKY